MSLRERQSEFARKVGLLILFIYDKGYEITFGDAWAKTGHCRGSFHYKRLAIDLNLFKDGEYLTGTADHYPFGKFWESLGGTWGGRWGDGNHYSYLEENSYGERK
ncbi:M15 family metallopeptidase [bacterium]|nr:M15 family metallopeptidase [bacterium]